MDIDGRVPESPLEQMKLALENIKRNLEVNEMEVNDLTKLVLYLIGDFEANQRRKIASDFLGEHLPCTIMLYVVALAASACRIECDYIKYHIDANCKKGF